MKVAYIEAPGHSSFYHVAIVNGIHLAIDPITGHLMFREIEQVSKIHVCEPGLKGSSTGDIGAVRVITFDTPKLIFLEEFPVADYFEVPDYLECGVYARKDIEVYRK